MKGRQQTVPLQLFCMKQDNHIQLKIAYTFLKQKISRQQGAGDWAVTRVSPAKTASILKDDGIVSDGQDNGLMHVGLVTDFFQNVLRCISVSILKVLNLFGKKMKNICQLKQ